MGACERRMAKMVAREIELLMRDHLPFLVARHGAEKKRMRVTVKHVRQEEDKEGVNNDVPTSAWTCLTCVEHLPAFTGLDESFLNYRQV